MVVGRNTLTNSSLSRSEYSRAGLGELHAVELKAFEALFFYATLAIPYDARRQLDQLLLAIERQPQVDRIARLEAAISRDARAGGRHVGQHTVCELVGVSKHGGGGGMPRRQPTNGARGVKSIIHGVRPGHRN